MELSDSIKENGRYLSGKIFEGLYFGKCRWEEEDLEYQSYFFCIKKIIESGETRKTLFTEALKTQLSQKLKSDIKKIKFYSALNSTLDRFHKVDGFILWEFEKDKFKLLTLDITMLHNKKYEADMLISFEKLTNFEGLVYEISEFLEKKARTLEKIRLF